MSTPEHTITRRRWRAFAILLIVSGAFGALIGALVTHLIQVPHGAGRWAAVGRLWPAAMGLAMLAQGLLVTVMSSNRRRAGYMVDPGDPREASLPQMRFYRNRALTFVLAGGALLVPASLATWSGLSEAGPVAPLGLLAVLLTGAAVAGTRMWKAADEFTRSLMAGSALMSLLAVLALMVAWHVATLLGVIASPGAWSVTGLALVLYLVVDSARMVRHGYFY